MSVPGDLKYTRSHEWLRKDDAEVVVGITQYAQEQLGEVVYVELPDVGRNVDANEEIGTLESVKAVSEFFAPIAGEIVAVNERLADEPNLVNDDPFGDGWLVRISASEDGDLLEPEEYQAFLEEESH
jgi:glycine cleavage system H protein